MMGESNWDEIRTAFYVARAGTVSGAAEALGVHHATVIRHIDSLETALGVKLFQRHARGYTPTEAGQDLFLVAQATEDQFSQLIGRLKGRGAAVTGELVVTALPGLSPFLVPVLSDFQRQYPGVVVRFLTDARLFRLEYGEAHVAIRAGSPPEEPDNVVQPFITLDTALYGSADYIARRGTPQTDADLRHHDFVTHDNTATRAPFHRWLHDTMPTERLTFRAIDDVAMVAAIRAGAGLGFLTCLEAEGHPDLVRVAEPRPEWASQSWLVTHVDLHRTAKVQAFLKALKTAAAAWA
jgi:DNA-binding transcriptional LysR family regulator